MSSSSTSGAHSWPRYGPVPLTRCPDCSRAEPLVRLICKKRDTGNFGHEFVKCESRPQPGQILKQCTHFMWMEAYIERLQVEGLLDLGSGAVSKPNLEFCAPKATVNGAAQKLLEDELKNINKKMSHLVELKKQENMINGAFYCAVVFLGLIYLFVLSRGR